MGPTKLYLSSDSITQDPSNLMTAWMAVTTIGKTSELFRQEN